MRSPTAKVPILAILVLVVAAPSPHVSARINAAHVVQAGPSPGVPRQVLPPRDPRSPAQTGTAVMRGRVVAADTKRPLRRARIQVSGPELGSEIRTTSTNAEGRYEIRELLGLH